MGKYAGEPRVRRVAMRADAVAAALVPYVVSNDVSRHRNRMVVWSEGIAKLIKDANGVVIRRYRNGRYARTVAVIEYKLFMKVKKILMDKRRLRRAVRRNKRLVIEAFKRYSPRRHGPEKLLRRLRELLGPRMGASLYRELIRSIPRTKTWTRDATRPRAYGFKLRLMGCIAWNKERYDAPDYMIEEACARSLRGDPFAFMDLIRYQIYGGG